MSPDALVAVLRSWEERFGAVVTSVGPVTMGLAVEGSAAQPEAGEAAGSRAGGVCAGGRRGRRTRQLDTPRQAAARRVVRHGPLARLLAVRLARLADVGGSPGCRGLAFDAIAHVGRVRRVEGLDRRQLEVGEPVEQALSPPRSTGARSRVARRRARPRGPGAPSKPRPRCRHRAPGDRRACSKAASKPSVTKWNVVPPSSSIGSRAWWVRTKTGAWYGGSSPPAAPVLVPGAADRAEHVAAHDVGAARRISQVGPSHRPRPSSRQVPGVDLQPADAEWVLAALARPGGEAVERDGHVAGGQGHGVSDCRVARSRP